MRNDSWQFTANGLCRQKKQIFKDTDLKKTSPKRTFYHKHLFYKGKTSCMLWPISRLPGCPSPMEVIGGERSAEQKLWCLGEGGTFSTNVGCRHSDWERHIRFGKCLLIKWMFSTGKHVRAVKIHPRWSWEECFRCWPEMGVSHTLASFRSSILHLIHSLIHLLIRQMFVESLGAGHCGRRVQQSTRLRQGFGF